MKAKDYIKQYCINNPKIVSSMIILSCLSLLFLIAMPLFLGLGLGCLVDISNDIEIENKYAPIIGILGFLFSAGMYYFIKYKFERKSNNFGSEITNMLRTNAYTSLLRGEYYDISNFTIEEIEETLLQSCETIGNKYYANHLTKLVYLFVSYLAIEIYLLVMNPVFGLIVFAVCLMYFGLSKYITYYQNKKAEMISKFKNSQENEIKFNIKNLKNIKIRNGVMKEEKEYAAISENGKKLYNNKSIADFLNNNFLVDIIIFLSIFGLCTYLYFSKGNFSSFNFIDSLFVPNKMTSLTIVCILTMLSINSFKSLIDCYNEKINISEAYKNINCLLELKPESRSETVSSLEDILNLTFNNVSYDYNVKENESNRCGVEKLNFELKRGEKLGIFGYKNTGKTTIADLISKIIRPKSGTILINNCDINKLSTAYLRNSIAYIPQNFNLMEGTIEQNIIYPMPLDEYRYNEALNKSQLKDLFLNLPKRDQEKISEINISKSDTERIGLAYALYKDSPIVILDEATNELAKENKVQEEEIMNEFFKLKNKMLIVVSSHPNIISKCDKVLIINNGKIVEYGNTIDLEKDKKSNYSKLLVDVNKKII